MGMALDPEWVLDMVLTYAKMTLMHQAVLFRIIASNDRARIEEELNRKILPVLKAGGGYILHSDHSIPPEVEHDTLTWFFDRASTIRRRM
jgi:uroporphyrinogen-III decarboxylase